MVAPKRHAACDVLGGVGEGHGLSHVCLVDSLRSLGIDVPYTTSGPFRALSLGNMFLSEFGKQLRSVPFSEVDRGRYVKWWQDHFVGVEIEIGRLIIQIKTKSVRPSLATTCPHDSQRELWPRLGSYIAAIVRNKIPICRRPRWTRRRNTWRAPLAPWQCLWGQGRTKLDADDQPHGT